ncbi:MAG: hypothetical protein U0Q16_29345 [Bryobacteraceae bacterium]
MDRALLICQNARPAAEVFFSDEDRRAFLGILREAAPREMVPVAGYCLLRAEARLLVHEDDAAAVARMLAFVRANHTEWLRTRKLAASVPWRGSFFQQPLSGDEVWWTLRDMELAPVRERIVDRAETWAWSSARDHLGLRAGNSLLRMTEWRERFTPAQWALVLEQPRRERAKSARVAAAAAAPLFE